MCAIDPPWRSTLVVTLDDLMDDLTPRLEEIERTLAHVKEYL
jgi:hypothetical protein